MRYLAGMAAAGRLEWLLDGLNGQDGWGADAAGVLAPGLAAAVSPGAFAQLIRRRAADLAPVTVTGLDVIGNTARARVRNHAEDSTSMVTCTVEAAPPHRIVAARTGGPVPAGLTARLPADFADYPVPAATGQQLIVFSGLPGSGKSTLADATGRRLGIPVFAIDWLLGALTPFGGRHLDNLLGIGSEMLTTLALRQLSAGQSAILDCPAEDLASRRRWQSLAAAAGAGFRVIVCCCPDPDEHQARLTGRTRGIPGWHEAGDWDNVQQRRTRFPAWDGNVLTVDTSGPPEGSLAEVLGYLAAGRPADPAR